jgi:hypothetical protein
MRNCRNDCSTARPSSNLDVVVNQSVVEFSCFAITKILHKDCSHLVMIDVVGLDPVNDSLRIVSIDLPIRIVNSVAAVTIERDSDNVQAVVVKLEVRKHATAVKAQAIHARSCLHRFAVVN